MDKEERQMLMNLSTLMPEELKSEVKRFKHWWLTERYPQLLLLGQETDSYNFGDGLEYEIRPIDEEKYGYDGVYIKLCGAKKGSKLTGEILSICDVVTTRAFYGRKGLTKVILPFCKTVGNEAFRGCSSLEEVKLDSCTYVAFQSFYQCLKLRTVSLLSCIKIGAECFKQDFELEKVDAPNLRTIEVEAFVSTALREADFPLVQTLGGLAFSNCEKLVSVNIRTVSKVVPSTFQGCTALKEIRLTCCEHIGVEAFKGCSSLQKIYLPNVQFIANMAFNGCSSLPKSLKKAPPSKRSERWG